MFKMMKITTATFLLLTAPLIMGVVAAQSTFVPYVQSQGDATISVTPDQAKITFSVVTQAQTAQAASTQNATATNSVISALQSLLGPNADIKTIGYALAPNYTYPPSQSPVLNSYNATNTIQITTSNLSSVGSIIDAGITAGANQVSSLQFGLKDDTAARGQALQLATQHAKSHADAMAQGLNMHTGAVQVIQETAIAQPVLVGVLGGTASNSSTPVQAGSMTVTANVTLSIALVQ